MPEKPDNVEQQKMLVEDALRLMGDEPYRRDRIATGYEIARRENNLASERAARFIESLKTAVTHARENPIAPENSAAYSGTSG